MSPETYTQDVETAKQLIADSGWSAEDLTYTTYAVNGASTAHYEVLKAQLAEIGITLNIETVDLTVMLEHSWVGENSHRFRRERQLGRQPHAGVRRQPD